jgi:hypothetical protein
MSGPRKVMPILLPALHEQHIVAAGNRRFVMTFEYIDK